MAAPQTPLTWLLAPSKPTAINSRILFTRLLIAFWVRSHLIFLPQAHACRNEALGLLSPSMLNRSLIFEGIENV